MGAKICDLKRDLGLLEIFCIASGAMISSGLFILPGIAFSKSGPAVILSYALASLLVIPAMFSKAELATAMPKAGGTYFFIDRSLGPLMGTMGGLAAWFSLAFKSAFALFGIGIFCVLINPIFDNEIYWKIIAVIFCLIFSAINIHGVRHSGKTQIALVIGLLGLLIFYIVAGSFFIKTSNFENFAPYGLGSIFSTAGIIFVSFGGLTKVCSIAEECKKPSRNIPLGIFLSWGIISLLYILVIAVTIGVTEPGTLSGTEGLRPISLGASVFLGDIGIWIMAIAAILAFVSTANAGILAASRDPMAMGKDQLLPSSFGKLSKRGTPTVSILFTTGFMVFVILFLDLEKLVKTASLLKISLFIFVMISLIVMRKSKIRNYRPTFKSPLFPWMQIAGVFGLIFIVIEMGLKDIFPLVLVGGFFGISLIWYWFFARDKIWREYSLIHIIEKITGVKKTGYLVDEELREIIIDRDDLTEKRFEKLVKNCEIIDVFKYMRPDKFAWVLSHKLSEKLEIDEDKLYNLLKNRKKDSNVVIHPGIGIFSHVIKGRDKFEMIIVRSKKGMIISDRVDPIHSFFVIVSSPDQNSFYLHVLMWIIQIAEETDFDEEWVKARDCDDLRRLLLESWKKRKKL